MLFPTPTFAVFFAVVYAASWTLSRRPIGWRLVLLAASYVFYGYWDPRFILLLAGSTVLNQTAALVLGHSRGARTRRVVLALAVGSNLTALGFFKYYGFLVASVSESLRALGLSPNLPFLEIVLPLGISFFTFQAISYIVDIYKGEIEPAPWLDFAVYLAFFPQLVAGPIVRGSELLPQLRQRPTGPLDTGRAFYLITIGLIKKVVIADLLATTLVDPVFASPQLHSGLTVLIAVYAYSVQIYADFSAYSDIAIGLALLLGFRFPENFNAPYAAASITDFWRRWHMTLSRWLRDYLYVPLGGNRKGRILTYRNLMLTMLLGGLWHGAAWRFVIWGGFHGALLAIERVWRSRREHRSRPEVPPSRARVIVQRVITFHLVSLAWILFRADSVSTAVDIAHRIATAWDWSTTNVGLGVVLAILATAVAHFVPRPTADRAAASFGQLRPILQGAMLGSALFVIDALGPEGVAAFIYFQF